MKKVFSITIVILVAVCMIIVCSACDSDKDNKSEKVRSSGDFYYTLTEEDDAVYATILGLTEKGRQKDALVFPYLIDGISVKAVGLERGAEGYGFRTENCTRIYLGENAVSFIDVFCQMPSLKEIYWSGYDENETNGYNIQDFLSTRYKIYSFKELTINSQTAVNKSNVVFRKYTKLTDAEELEKLFESNQDKSYYKDKLAQMQAQGMTFEDLAAEENAKKVEEAAFWYDNCEDKDRIFFPPEEIADYFKVSLDKYYSDPECTCEVKIEDLNFSGGELILYCK